MFGFRAFHFLLLLVTGVSILNAKGKYRYHDVAITINPAWKNVVWVELTEVDEALCTNNRVSIDGGNGSALSIILAAKMSNKQISVTVDNTVFLPANSNYGEQQYLSIK